MTELLYQNLLEWIATAADASRIRDVLRPLADELCRPFPIDHRHLMRRKIRRARLMAMVTVFVPKSLVADPKKLARAVANALDGAAKGALVDFKVTTQTWQHQPAFDIQEPAADTRIVGTNDEIYKFVTGGTKPHVIVAHGKALAFPGGGFRPKTRPRYIGSNKGSKGGAIILRPKVQHPGTTAREFEEAIAEKWQKELPITMQRAIDSEL